ncbi:transglycosylase domain-containing protein [Effusibacillus consociatus]|uniref:PBP1A family penicillin-binding protein n=1 Tax=Effusibacillus consociatus TaxID=1117041 RepID=A0ABV9Q5U4_9BACL
MGKKVIRSIVLAMIITGTIVLGVGCAVTLPAMDPSKLETPNTVTRIYDRNQKPAVEIRLNKGDPVPYAKVPEYLKQAIVATEDRQFYDHDGISYRAIARAVYKDIITGSKAEGGSTITQQLARNALLGDQDKTFTRKIKEIALAMQIEREYTKDDILEMYMNKVNFHPSILGIEAAAKIYFNKSVGGDGNNKLSLGEAAFLAGLPQAPSYYYNNLDQAYKRRDIVLDNMIQEGYITEQQANEAKKVKVNPNYKKSDPNNISYPQYVDYILQEAEEKYGIPRHQILRGGLNIYTHLDTNAQEAVEKQFRDPANFPPNAADKTPVQGAMVIVNHKTGGIVALAGARDVDSFQNLNRAFLSDVFSGRQPGSSIKPLLSYGPAIDLYPNKYHPDTMLNDKKGSNYGGFVPNDWDNHRTPREQVPMWEALRQSWNIPAVDVLADIGIPEGKKFAEKAGIPFHKNDNNYAIALGAFTQGVSPLNMADAYQAFANKGVRIPAHAITKITTGSGAILAQTKVSPVQVMKESTASTMTSLLQVVVNKGTGTAARLPDRAVAGKTGTTEYKREIAGSNKDTWFVGYTPELVAAVWMGFDVTDDNHYLKDQPSRFVSAYPAQLFSKVMPQALKNYPKGSFNVAPVEEPKKEEPQVLQVSGEWNGKAVTLKWNSLKGDVQYNVFRTENAGQTEGGIPIGMMLKEPVFVDTDAQPGKSYYYSVSAYDANGKELAQSNLVPIKTEQPKDKDKDAKDKEKEKEKDKPKDPAKPPTPGTGGDNTGILPGGSTGTGGSGGTGGNTGGSGGTGGQSGGGSTGGTGDPNSGGGVLPNL